MDKLDLILENTNTIKEVVVVEKKEKTEKDEKKKEAQKKAASKFKQIKTNINEELQEKVNERIEKLGTNTSNYIQSLIKSDLSSEIVPKTENVADSMENENKIDYKQYYYKASEQRDKANAEIISVKEDYEKKAKELIRFKSMSILEFIKYKLSKK